MSEPGIQLETVNLLLADGVATVELNRPAALNAWNTQLGLDLLAALRRVAEDDAVRAVLITGAGRAFSSGADLKDLSGGETTPDGRPDVYKTLTERYHPIMHAIREMGKPVIAAVNGPAVGIGCSLALCCDLIVAAESAYFLLAFVNIGLVPDGGSSLFVPSRIGMARATELAMLGERLGAARALEWGLINRVVAPASLDAEVTKLAQQISSKSPLVVKIGKQAFYAQIDLPQPAAYASAIEVMTMNSLAQDAKEGIASFLGKRTPAWIGR